MEKLQKKSQNLKLLVVASLLMITPLVSTSLRFKYLYFIVNMLIIAVVADAGLLSFFLQPAAASLHVPQKPAIIIPDNHDEDEDEDEDDDSASSEKIAAEVEVEVEESAQGNNELIMDASIEEDHELYEKSETFIGNFYKQLKMQR